jgi:hypothetical protein
MRSLLARLAVLGAFAVAVTACSGGSGNALPFAGPPNNAGGSPGTIQSGSNGLALLRFVQGSPDSTTIGNPSGTVDICIDNLAWNVTQPQVSYGKASALDTIAGGIPHTISVYSGHTGPDLGAECATAPGPYFGPPALAVTTLTPGNNTRFTIVLGGTAATGTFGLYVFAEPTFPAPAGMSAISHNAAPVFSTGKPSGVGFGICTTTATPCATPVVLAGAQGLAAAKKSSATVATATAPVQSPLNSIPAGFYDGIGVPAGNPVPVTSVTAPNSVNGQAYIVELYAFDAPAGGLNLLAVPEQTSGYGF